MPDEIADRLQIEVRVDEALHRRVPQRVRTRTRNLHSNAAQVAAGQRRHRRRPDRVPGCDRPEEHVAVCGLRAAVLEIVDDRFADHL
jgi:hypothetical protein